VQSLRNNGNLKWKSIDISCFANASRTVHDANFDCAHRKVCWLLLLRCKNCRLAVKKCVLDFTIFAGKRMTVRTIDLRLWSQIIIHFFVIQFVLSLSE
jgi:hypothetical protein